MCLSKSQFEYFLDLVGLEIEHLGSTASTMLIKVLSENPTFWKLYVDSSIYCVVNNI